MGKMHELLAVEADREAIYKKFVDEAINTFSKKVDHFMGQVRLLDMFDDSQKNLNTTDRKELVTTVDEKLSYVEDAAIKYFDVVLQKEKTNQAAVADLEVDGQVLATGLPATFLLGLETKLKFIRGMYEAIPTLDPGIEWDPDTSEKSGVYKTVHPDEKFKTAKTFQFRILVPPTDKHPAQVEKWEEQIPVGKYTTTAWSGKLSPGKKAYILGRIDKLIQAAKQARMRANNIDVVSMIIGEKIFDFIRS